MICILAPLELSQLVFAIIGALVYAGLQAMTPKPRSRPRSGPSSAPHASSSVPPAPHPVKPEVYHPSSNPVFAPKFESTGWEAEVSELASQLAPGGDEDHAVQRLVCHVKRTIQSLFTEVEVTGFVHSSLKCGKAFGVAVPEVDIVANVTPA